MANQLRPHLDPTITGNYGTGGPITRGLSTSDAPTIVVRKLFAMVTDPEANYWSRISAFRLLCATPRVAAPTLYEAARHIAAMALDIDSMSEREALRLADLVLGGVTFKRRDIKKRLSLVYDADEIDGDGDDE